MATHVDGALLIGVPTWVVGPTHTTPVSSLLRITAKFFMPYFLIGFHTKVGGRIEVAHKPHKKKRKEMYCPVLYLLHGSEVIQPIQGGAALASFPLVDTAHQKLRLDRSLPDGGRKLYNHETGHRMN